MSDRPSERIYARRNRYKVTVDAGKRRRRRDDNTRNSRREELLLKKRREGIQAHAPISAAGFETKLESLPDMVVGVNSDDNNLQLEAMTKFRQLLSIERSPPIEEVIWKGVVSRFVHFLTKDNFTQLQLEAAWALANIASDTSDNTKVVIDIEAVPIFVKLLRAGDIELREKAVCALGNVAGDSPNRRDAVLAAGALMPLLAMLNENYLLALHVNARLSMFRSAIRTLSNFCGGDPRPAFVQTKPALPALARLITSSEEEVLTETCWILSFLSDGTSDKNQSVIDAGICHRLVELLSHTSPSVVLPALRTIGNIVRGDAIQAKHIIDHQALPRLLSLLTHDYEIIKKEACWTISNITAGNTDQIQAVIDAEIVGPLVNQLETAVFSIRKEAAWAISNATLGGSHDQIKYLVTKGCIWPLCNLLVCQDPIIVTVCLEGLENILIVGEDVKNSGVSDDVNVYAQMIAEAEGVLEKIENLQSHASDKIYEKAVNILKAFWSTRNVDDAMGEAIEAPKGAYCWIKHEENVTGATMVAPQDASFKVNERVEMEDGSSRIVKHLSLNALALALLHVDPCDIDTCCGVLPEWRKVIDDATFAFRYSLFDSPKLLVLIRDSHKEFAVKGSLLTFSTDICRVDVTTGIMDLLLPSQNIFSADECYCNDAYTDEDEDSDEDPELKLDRSLRNEAYFVHGTCEGMILISMGKTLIVYNPFISRWGYVQLLSDDHQFTNNVKSPFCDIILGFFATLQTNREHKILYQAEHGYYTYSLEIQEHRLVLQKVQDLSVATPLQRHLQTCLHGGDPPFKFDNCLYWKSGWLENHMLTVFDIKKLEFSSFHAPLCCQDIDEDHLDLIQLMTVKGKLAVVLSNKQDSESDGSDWPNSEIYVWVREDKFIGCWSLEHTHFPPGKQFKLDHQYVHAPRYSTSHPVVLGLDAESALLSCMEGLLFCGLNWNKVQKQTNWNWRNKEKLKVNHKGIPLEVYIQRGIEFHPFLDQTSKVVPFVFNQNLLVDNDDGSPLDDDTVVPDEDDRETDATGSSGGEDATGSSGGEDENPLDDRTDD